MGLEGQVQESFFLPPIHTVWSRTQVWPIWFIDKHVAVLERRGWKGEPMTDRLGPGQQWDGLDPWQGLG